MNLVWEREHIDFCCCLHLSPPSSMKTEINQCGKILHQELSGLSQ
uniref:Uncharacterized protein n=1 Tax=Rhizophora mucronata TaxID=61149 RepID=A0A2P2PCG6_RHIMU